MKPHPRIRKTIKWGGAAVTVLLVVVWVASMWCYVELEGESTSVGVTAGMLCVDHVHPDWHNPGFRFGLRAQFWVHWGFLFRGPEGEHLNWIPLWFPSVLAAIVSTGAWRLDALARRRAKLNLCPKCGYDRTGILQDAKCPECGAGPASV